MSILRGPHLVLRPVEPVDVPRLISILREPTVARRWSAPDDEADGRSLLGEVDDEEAERITTFAILLGDEAIGWIAGFGQAGSAFLPFLTGALASKSGIKSLQPL